MRVLYMSVAMVAAMSVSACAPAKDPTPTKTAQETFKGCTWGKVQGKGPANNLSIWSYACGAAMGNEKLVADDSLPGFAIETSGPEGITRRTVIRVFTKAADAPFDSVLPAIRAASPGPVTARCELVVVPPSDDLSGRLYELEPVGADKVAYDKANAVEPGPAPCGEMGISAVGDRFFKELADDPTKVVLIDMGSEIQIFDPSTLTVEK